MTKVGLSPSYPDGQIAAIAAMNNLILVMFQTSFTLMELGLKTGLIKNHPSHLHLRSHRKKSDRMGNLVTLHLAILHPCEEAMRGIVDEMKRVCQQWP